MPLEMWVAFVFTASANILAPGPAIVLALRNGMTLGAKPAVFSSLGNIAAICIVGTLVAIGLGAVIGSHPQVLAAMRLAGGGYLLWLAVKASQKGLLRLDLSDGAAPPRYPAHKLFGQAMAVGLTNPKMILFLTALFPMFISRDYPMPVQFAVMTATFMAMSFMILMTIALTASKVAGFIRSARAQRWINRTVSLVFGSFGLGMIWLGVLGFIPA
ncbi:LysE family translocator [Aestuariispira ectoiniformans]|uniref:LysE family translocator n=1 Tax=Aestuariispira ectoiniformans TaxID=2775080 RepID=UPI00223C20CE|nr:LysE family translocator [Aestuariispira ectoiniformans]